MSSITLKDVDQPTEGVKLTTPNVQAFFSTNSLGNGTLYITGTQVTWITNGSKGFNVTYPAIVLHAISSEVSHTFPEHVFVMVDQRKSVRRRRAPVLRTIQEDDEQRGLELAAAELEDEESDDDEEGRGLEIRFSPDDKGALVQIYNEICRGQEENPEEDDPMFEDEEEEEEQGDGEEMHADMEGNRWFTADNLDQVQMNEEGLANMQRIFGRGDQQDEAME